MSPLNSLSVSLSRKLDFPAPASPAKTRRYIGAGSSVSSMSASNGFKHASKNNKYKQNHVEIILVCDIKLYTVRSKRESVCVSVCVFFFYP